MPVDLHGVVTVLLPGTGSDDEYLKRAFADPLHEVGARLVAVHPEPAALLAGYLRALEQAAADGPIAVGGVSLGAAVAAGWALDHPGEVVAVLAALPPWTGAPDDAPGAVSARYTAGELRRAVLAATTAAMRASSPSWLADELARSWRRQWPDMPGALEEAAGFIAPGAADLGRLEAPMGIAAAPDDPIHPLAIAQQWVAAAPCAALRTLTLQHLGADPAALGRACLDALGAAGGGDR